MKRSTLVLVVLVLVLLGEAASAQAGFFLSTLGQETGPIAPWGTPDSGASPSYGQLFAAPAGNSNLQSLTFEVANSGTTAIPFQAYVYAWNGTAVTGNPLFVSSPQSVAPSGGSFSQVTVATPNTQLTPGSQYVALFSTIGFPGLSATGSMRLTPLSAYPGGSFEFNNTPTFAGLSGGWNLVGGTPANFNSNLAFQMAFSPGTPPPVGVPEPTSLTLLVLGSLGLAGYGWRRKKAA
jgi:hypothetical protein